MNRIFSEGMIYETAVYCGRLKEWRVLNLNTDTIYTRGYDSEELALDSIDSGEIRSGKIVKRLSLREIFELVDKQ